jgi:hypothetical protein
MGNYTGSLAIGVTISAENIGTAFKVAEDYLQKLHPRLEVIVQAVQRINNELSAPRNGRRSRRPSLTQ